MPKYTTPGVHVQERPTSPAAVVDVASAVPAFVGYTAHATRLSPGDLAMQPTRIATFVEFESLFGGGPAARVSEVQVDAKGNFLSATSALDYVMSQSLRLYFSNGGGPCYVVSVGANSGLASAIDSKTLVAGIETLAASDEPTLLVCPEAALLGEVAMAEVQKAMLQQCSQLKDRFAVLDTRLDDPQGKSFRDQIGVEALRYGAAYTPWLNAPATCAARYVHVRDILRHGSKPVFMHDLTADPAVLSQLRAIDQALDANPAADVAPLELWLEHNFAVYRSIIVGVRNNSSVACPPSGAVAGVYVAMDTHRGVWKAPANVALSGVIASATSFDADQLSALNVDATAGKSINTIRVFTGKGVLIWSARTLAGNDNEWRYISVRRFFIWIEESLKKATERMVFEPNDANTWNKVRAMSENYLMQKWRDGALAGTKPEQAFFVHCGVGQTMTAQDVLEGRLIVEIGMAVVRPAEFIILRFSHHMQNP